MVGQLKEDVAEWYQGLSAHRRIEAMCTLIDLSMPFEIRFLGTLIEHLGRKDFGSLRDAESKANSFANGNPDDKKKLLQSLGEVAAPLCAGNGTQFVNPLIHPASFNDSPANRPSPTHVSDPKGRQPPPQSDLFHGSDSQNDLGVSGDSSLNSHDTSGPKGSTKGVSSVPNHIGFSSEEETESMCIVNDLKRRKLILYISVLSPTNHDGANLYYTILSDIEDNPALTWLEDLDKDAQEEVSLLYTLASRHPAFTFEQRMFLGTVANRVNEIVGSKFPSRANVPLQQPPPQSQNSNPGTHPIYYNHIPHVIDPKYGGGYYIFAHPPMHIQQPPHQPSSVPSNGEQIRNPGVAAPFPAYASFGQYFVPHHPAAISHPTPLNSPYAQSLMGSSMPITSSATLVTGAGQNLPQAPPAAAGSNSNSVLQGNNVVGAINCAHQLSSPSGKLHHSQLPNASNSMSQHSCVSTPSRTSSVPFQSEQNSVDGDSAEESSENCDWNSPESSSPYESPAQSLTPSRSQSPPSGVQNSTSVKAVSLSGHGPATFLVTSGGNSIPYGGSGNNVSSNNSSSSSSTIVKTEIHNTSSGLVITTATSCSSTSCLTTTSNMGNSGNGPTSNSNSSSSNNSGNNYNSNKALTTSVAASMHHPQLPIQCHLPHQPTSGRGPTKNNTSSVPSNSNNQSFSNHPPNAVVVSSSVISVSQQPQIPQSMMGPTVPVHMQQTTLTSANNVGGIVSHSMSSANPQLAVAFAQQSHGAHNNLGHPPPAQNSFPCYPHMNTAVSFGAMNAAAAYRASAQSVLTRNQYIQSHPAVAATSALLNNQLGMKGPDLQRGHNVHSSLRQKTQLQNTPKRRSNVNMPVNVGGSTIPNNSQSTSGKGDEACDSGKDNRNSEIVVSANPSNNKGSLQQQERTSKPYHHNLSNGLVSSLPGSSVGAALPGNSLPNIISNNSSGIPNQIPQASGVTNAGGPIIPTVPSKVGEDGLLGDGVAGIDGYSINQIPYHVNGPPIYGHPGGPFMLPNGYMASSYYNPAMGAAAAAAMAGGGPPGPPSTEIMMNPSCVPHFSFPFTIPHSFSNLPSTTSSKGISNAKEKPNSLHGNSVVNAGGATDSSSKSIPSNQHENHVTVTPASHSSGYYRTASQPSRNNRGVILDIGGGALGNSSLSPVNVDVAAMPPIDDLVETIHRPRKISCYNCGLDTHLGPDCKEGSMEEMTRHQFRVNYSGPSSVTADGKDGD